MASLDNDRLPKEMQSALQRASFILPRSEIEVQEKIGKGAFSEVFRGKYKGVEVAIKRVLVHDEKDKDAEKYLHTELAILTNVKHKNLLKYYGAAFERPSGTSAAAADSDSKHPQKGMRRPSGVPSSSERAILIITELLKGGDLSTLLLKHQEIKLPWKLRLSVALQISQAIDHLHEHELIHRDIKTENVLVDQDWRPVLADYGLTRKPSSSRAMTICGTDEFMAPEVIFGESYDERADVFSFGMVLAEIIYRRRPGKDGFLEREARTKFNIDLEQLDQDVPEGCPPSLLECCKQCLAYEPDERLETESVVDWLSDLYNECEETREHVPGPVDILGSAAIGSPEHLEVMKKKEEEQRKKFEEAR